MCKEPGCEKKVRARGLCINHYSTWYVKARSANGNPLPDRTWRASTDWTKEDYEDFWQFVKKEVGIV